MNPIDILYLQVVLNQGLVLHAIPPNLLDDQVHVWLADISQNRQWEGELESVLNAEEIKRARSFRKLSDQGRFILQHGMLRMLLGHYLAKQPQQLVLHQPFGGKPKVNAIECTLDFNLSHAGDYALYAFSCNRQVGVDIEKLRNMDDILKVAQSVFSQKEIRMFQGLDDQHQQELFLKLWVRKEAYLKARGMGFQLPPTHISIGIDADTPGGDFLVYQQQHLEKGWLLRDLVAPLGYAAALCYSA